MAILDMIRPKPNLLMKRNNMEIRVTIPELMIEILNGVGFFFIQMS